LDKTFVSFRRISKVFFYKDYMGHIFLKGARGGRIGGRSQKFFDIVLNDASYSIIFEYGDSTF